jgi:hypothetical protein
VSAALCEHALKRWPVELWRRGEPGAEARLVGVMHMMRALAEGADALEAFFVPFGGSA